MDINGHIWYFSCFCFSFCVVHLCVLQFEVLIVCSFIYDKCDIIVRIFVNFKLCSHVYILCTNCGILPKLFPVYCCYGPGCMFIAMTLLAGHWWTISHDGCVQPAPTVIQGDIFQRGHLVLGRITMSEILQSKLMYLMLSKPGMTISSGQANDGHIKFTFM